MQSGDASPAIPAFDTHTLGLTICPWPSCHGGYPFFVSVAGKLFLAEYLGDPPPHGSTNKTPWTSWTTMTARPPFYTSKVICYALHPDGRAAAASTTGKSLPRDGTGFLCSCDVVVPADAADADVTSPPGWKLGVDRVFRKEPQLHLGAKLVYTGGDGRFCLVESLVQRDDEHMFREDRYPRRRVLRVTTFGLRFSKNGELRTMLRGARSCSRMYNRCHGFWDPVDPTAFWL
ncbi:hypothetical protein PR202_ga03054 [Eleusine coracana subsp. coracana]|nr:hypothetical protein PR202_ga03054 [Eleusine coracana subsp. coracana]